MPPEGPKEETHRLHPATLLFTLGNSIKVLLLPGLAVLLFARGYRYDLWLMALFLPTVLYRIFRYLTLTYRFGEKEMVVRAGLIFRQERHIPYDRIDNVGLVQGATHRLVGVATVRLETAGGVEPEAELEVLSLAAVEYLRARILSGRSASAGTGGADRPAEGPAEVVPAEAVTICALSTGELVKLGFISLRGLLLIPLLFALAEQFDLFDRLDLDALERAVASTPEGAFRPVRVAALTAAVVLAFLGLSVAWTILRFHGYRLERTGELLRVTCGLWTKVSATLGRHRIQVITVRESLGHRLFGRVSVQIETAGGSDEKSQLSRKWFVPLLPRAEAARVLNELRPGFDLTQAAWRPLAPRAVRRKLVGNCIPVLIPTAACLGVVLPAYLWVPEAGPVLWLVLVIPPLLAWAVLHALLWSRRTCYAQLGDGLVYRTGVLNRKTTATFCDKIQVVVLSQSPFDRRHRMAALTLDTAGTLFHAPLRIPYLEEGVARELFRTLSAGAETAAFRW